MQGWGCSSVYLTKSCFLFSPFQTIFFEISQDVQATFKEKTVANCNSPRGLSLWIIYSLIPSSNISFGVTDRYLLDTLGFRATLYHHFCCPSWLSLAVESCHYDVPYHFICGHFLTFWCYKTFQGHLLYFDFQHWDQLFLKGFSFLLLENHNPKSEAWVCSLSLRADTFRLVQWT